MINLGVSENKTRQSNYEHQKIKEAGKQRLGLLTVTNMRMRMDLLLGDIRMMMVDIRLDL